METKNLVIIAIMVIVAIVLIVMLIPRGSSANFSPRVLGTIAEVSSEQMSGFISNTPIDEVRALAVMSRDTYNKKRGQLKRSMELYSLIDQRLFPQIYEKVFSGLNGTLAKDEDLGGIILAHHAQSNLEIYAMLANAVGEPMSVANQQFATKNQSLVAVNSFYHNLKGLSDYLVIQINGPNLTDLDKMGDLDIGETVLDDGDTFGMYDSALTSWLEDNDESFGMYDSSLTGWLTENNNTRIKSPQESVQTTPDITRYIRNKTSKTSAITQRSDPY